MNRISVWVSFLVKYSINQNIGNFCWNFSSHAIIAKNIQFAVYKVKRIKTENNMCNAMRKKRVGMSAFVIVFVGVRACVRVCVCCSVSRCMHVYEATINGLTHLTFWKSCVWFVWCVCWLMVFVEISSSAFSLCAIRTVKISRSPPFLPYTDKYKYIHNT